MFCTKQFIIFEDNKVYNTTMCKTRQKANKQAPASGLGADTRVAMATSAQHELPYPIFQLRYHVATSFFGWSVVFSGGDCFGF